ncbi:hypothetical protein QUA20_21760 [Microcoleus sp. Pol7_A1]|uniref:hypothetical protein n=1 Tax=Microcoleus sp. Pol7_A1 TaxID=2818893 RepID=UPI002FD178E7
MSQTKVKKLTPEQAALIPVYREKWRAIALSTGPIDRSQAAETILLKMTCPNTGFVQALRVPPEVRSAKEAIRWVNWDINPEKFSVQT